MRKGVKAIFDGLKLPKETPFSIWQLNIFSKKFVSAQFLRLSFTDLMRLRVATLKYEEIIALLVYNTYHGNI